MMRTPLTPLPRSRRAVLLVPIQLPSTRLSSPSAEMSTPSPALPEITLPAPGWMPPTVFPLALTMETAGDRKMVSPLGSGARPVNVERRTVTIAGRVIGPLDRPPRSVSVMQAKDCTGRSFRRAARGVKVSRDGRFRVTVAPPRGLDVAYYRALTRVRRHPATRGRSAPSRSCAPCGSPAEGTTQVLDLRAACPRLCPLVLVHPAEALGVQPVGLLDDVVARQRLHLARLRLRALLGDPAVLAQLRVKASVSGRNWQLWALAEFSRCESTRAAELERRRANSASSQPARAAAGPYCDNSPIPRKGLA